MNFVFVQWFWFFLALVIVQTAAHVFGNGVVFGRTNRVLKTQQLFPRYDAACFLLDGEIIEPGDENGLMAGSAFTRRS